MHILIDINKEHLESSIFVVQFCVVKNLECEKYLCDIASQIQNILISSMDYLH